MLFEANIKLDLINASYVIQRVHGVMEVVQLATLVSAVIIWLMIKICVQLITDQADSILAMIIYSAWMIALNIIIFQFYKVVLDHILGQD